MKLKVMAAMIPALFAASSFAADIEGANSQVTFTGKIVASTCVIDTSSSGSKLAVDFGEVSDKVLSAKDKTSAEKSFNVSLSGCIAAEETREGGLTGAYIKFKGETVGNESTLKTANDTVGIQIKQGGDVIRLDGATPTSTVKFENGAATLNFTANYLQIADEVKTGDASAQANFTVYYN
ncbi:type 1 fimbrial protein [Enterobacter cloacae]|uniref:fimbrial protein n=1 Tax=Enterobacter cloacae TaxID=550 RepID=UPI000E5363EA|nr:fimbrial protein [Enterobacter cloacae]RHH96553.1 type 1 fimbrial protein [Enterobacter cloacae]